MPATDRSETQVGRFRASFEDALFPLWIMDLHGQFIEVNEALVKMLGHPRESLLGTNYLDSLHPDEREHNAGKLLMLQEGTRETSFCETRLLRADGSAIWVAIALAAMMSSADPPKHLIGQAFDVTARRQHEQRLRHLADHDPLTGLLNRRGFDRELRRHVSRADRYGAEGSLLMIDVDDFKRYNDGYGHAAGDEALRRIATVLSGRLRAGDVVGRIGGDEFAVLLPQANSEQAATVADALVTAIRDSDHEGRHVTVSIGVFSFGADGESVSEDRAMVGADTAMYAAKQAGRDGFVPFEANTPA